MKDHTQQESSESAEKYPRPDRSGYHPNFHKTPENECLDLGWADGQFSDGRPFRMEVWAMDGMTGLTYFFSRQRPRGSYQRSVHRHVREERPGAIPDPRTAGR